MLIVIEKLLSKAEVAELLGKIETGDWQDGAATAKGAAKSRKRNLQLDESAEPALSLSRELAGRVANHPVFISAALPRKIYPPRFNLYADGGAYGVHIDAALMRAPGQEAALRSDLSATIFLSEPDTYDGGELEIEGSYGAQTVKLEAGDMVLYLASSLHRVTPVTRGKRYAAFFWVESLVRDDGERALLFDLDQIIQSLAASAPSDANLTRLTGLYHNLLRRWAVT